MSKEAMQMALDALESIFASTHPYREDGTCTINDESVKLSNRAITAIENALEAKEKPSQTQGEEQIMDHSQFYMTEDAYELAALRSKIDTDYERGYEQGKADATKKMHPEIRKCLEDYFGKCFEAYQEEIEAYVQPPRQWVGLTDEEREELMDNYDVASPDYAKAIEAKLKEKNR